MSKNLRAIVVKGGPKSKRPDWSKSKPGVGPVTDKKEKLDRGANHEPNFTAQIVPVYNRAQDRMGYSADTSEKPEQVGAYSSEAPSTMDEQIESSLGLSPYAKWKKWRAGKKKAAAVDAAPPRVVTQLVPQAPKRKRPKKDPNQLSLGMHKEHIDNVVEAMLEDGYSPELIEALFETPEFLAEFERAIAEQTEQD